MKTYIVGAGGVGSFAVPVLCNLIGPANVIVMDGDRLEGKNLDRQLYDSGHIDWNKAKAMASKYNCEFIEDWFSFGVMPFDMDDWIICLVDNHAGRAAVLDTCDYNRCRAIFAANETHSSEAYVYVPEWLNTNLDPRIMFPEIATDLSGDPRRASIGCTGEAQEKNRQLVTANFMAAALAMHLYVVWAIEAEKLGPEVVEHLPHRLVQNLSRNESFKAKIVTTTTNEERTNNE